MPSFYKTEYSDEGVRFTVLNPPAAGTRMHTTQGDAVIFQGIGHAGMLCCTRLRDSSQQIYFPAELQGWTPVHAPRKSHLADRLQVTRRALVLEALLRLVMPMAPARAASQ